LERSPLRRLVELVARPGLLSLAGGLPAPELLPAEAHADAAAAVLRQDPRALQYGPPHRPLAAAIVRLLARRGVVADPSSILITTGAQQAIDIACRLLVEPGAAVITERAVYGGIRQSLAVVRPSLSVVGTDLEDGMDVDALARLLEGGVRPSLLYAISDGHNPCGVELSPDKRHRLVELSRQYGFVIVEDDAYGLLSYGAPFAPPLLALAPERVIYIGSLSKILAPSLRVGWMVLPACLYQAAMRIKEAIDLETSALNQRVAARLLAEPQLEAHLTLLRRSYAERLAAMLSALAIHFPERARYTRPRGGMFVWVELPPGYGDTWALLERAIAEENVAFAPERCFAMATPSGRALRLSFSTASPAEIEDGVARLGRLLAGSTRQQ
jgi:2-aminoadipate transaminase